MFSLLHAITFMVLLLVGCVIWNNKPLPLPYCCCAEGRGFDSRFRWLRATQHCGCNTRLPHFFSGRA